MPTRFQVPTVLHNQLEARAKEVGLSVEDAVVQAITLWLAEVAKARLTALALTALVEPKAPPGSTDLDKRLAELAARLTSQGIAKAKAKPEDTHPRAEPLRASEDGWDPYAEPWE